MPHQIDCPKNFEEFTTLVSHHVIHPIDFKELINRIITWNSAKLPGAEGEANKNIMLPFIDILLKYFIERGDMLATSAQPDAIMEEVFFLFFLNN
jgi:hypothetical protein